MISITRLNRVGLRLFRYLIPVSKGIFLVSFPNILNIFVALATVNEPFKMLKFKDPERNFNSNTLTDIAYSLDS